MVKQEIMYWQYLWKTQYILLLLPLFFMACSIMAAQYNADLSINLLLFVTFPVLIFPMIATLYQIGSLHHKELLLTYPLNVVLFGWIRPVLLSLIYSLCFTASLMPIKNYANEELVGAYTAAVLYMNLASFILILFKNIGMGIALPLAFLFYGMFTTGSGISSFYLMQWSRPSPDTTLEDCIITQGFTAIILSLAAVYCLKSRNKYHWNI
ncbi:hypothetical protein JJQ72_02410 [Paenibacillus sp. F411]|uniref:ABC-2 family transporter protein n=1 Tax=Paenibacillus algicola TaxID=2565926 RepID=A0A4P8XJY9_9BACL|nr:MULTISPECIES: hypothetical protein [Paenibacillus]MBO2942829.1 hypothetical protein [Paenibacillus sp. F411]QCT02977.1 hypothetical protein E6C60_2264 [Paenibacillus algicola]